MPVATGNMIYFYSNDGTYLESYHGLGDYAVIETGLIETGSGNIFTYSGEKKFIGFASSANATSPTYPIGSTITLSGSDILLYIVEEDKEPKVTITYNENVIASLGAGQTATLQCNGKKMIDNIIVTAPEVENSPLPIEVATEEEMNSLLETAEIGDIYKYTGETTDTYENGALYVVEEEAEITDLTGTTWVVASGWEVESGYGQFTVDGTVVFGDNSTKEFIGVYLGYDYDEGYFEVANYGYFILESSNYPYAPNNTVTITFTGGTDVTNTDLITWLKANATKQ